jgi:anti-sigma factor RsiW
MRMERAREFVRHRRRTAGQGYNLIHWNRSGMSFWAASDVEGEELERVAAILCGRIGVR